MIKNFIKSGFKLVGLYSVIRFFSDKRRSYVENENRKAVFTNMYPESKESYYIHSLASLEHKDLIEIGEGTEISEYVIIKTLKNKVKIGKFVQLNPFTVIYGGSGVVIGNNVMIAPHCMIASGNHDYKQTNYPMRFAGTLTKGPIVIEENVWIGANCTITDGVRIGKESLIAANSVVINNVEEWSIMSGVPAVKIGSRLPVDKKSPA
jgi:acetyltransferase-like isoleucine patch superfamily enzyme